MKKIKIVLIVLIVLFVVPFAHSGENKVCQGKVAQYYVSKGGALVLVGSYRNQWTTLCSTISTWKGVDPLVCLQYQGILKSAVLSDKVIKVLYSNLDYECDELPAYNNAPAPEYLMLVK